MEKNDVALIGPDVITSDINVSKQLIVSHKSVV